MEQAVFRKPVLIVLEKSPLDAAILAPGHMSVAPTQVGLGLIDRTTLIQQQNADGSYQPAAVDPGLAMNERRFRARFEHAQ